MPYFGSGGVTAATQVVEISGGYHVTIGLLTGREVAECQLVLNSGKKATTRVTARVSGRQQQNAEQVTEAAVDYAAYRDAVLLKGIKSWDLDDENGQVVPVDAAHIGGMLERDRDKAFEAITEFNNGPDADADPN